tara:strand:+ start:714 stop:1889 length:1176 start_codon:yes stop_codon:yes gene_type:complete
MACKCRLCDKENVELLINFGEQPIVHHLLKRRDETYDEFPFQLGYCPNCSFLQLLQPISAEILYENYFTISAWKNQPHVERLIDVMKSITGMNKNSRLLEIGCNDGSFIEILSKHGINNCIGIEPSNDAYQLALSKNIHVYNEFFSYQNSKLPLEKQHYDIIICRQVLEHISNLEKFMMSVDYYLNNNGYFVIEVPDSNCQLKYMDYALWEEHVNYFTLHTLQNLLNKYDFEIFHYETTLFSGKAITIFAEKKAKKNNFHYKVEDLDQIISYGLQWPRFKEQAQEMVSSRNEVAIYGCGARSSTFVNFLELENVAFFIDDQKEKQKYFVPGRRLEIVSWDDHCSDGFFLLGVNTENEIKVINKRKLNARQFASILPPSRHLPEFWKNMICA